MFRGSKAVARTHAEYRVPDAKPYSGHYTTFLGHVSFFPESTQGREPTPTFNYRPGCRQAIAIYGLNVEMMVTPRFYSYYEKKYWNIEIICIIGR